MSIKMEHALAATRAGRNIKHNISSLFLFDLSVKTSSAFILR